MQMLSQIGLGFETDQRQLQQGEEQQRLGLMDREAVRGGIKSCRH